MSNGVNFDTLAASSKLKMSGLSRKQSRARATDSVGRYSKFHVMSMDFNKEENAFESDVEG